MNQERQDEIVDLFLPEMRERLGSHLKQVILFGFRASGDDIPGSEYDCLVVLDEASPALVDVIDELAGDILDQHNAVFSVFAISEEKYRQETYDPFLMNVRGEGIVV
jgi:predicted nucleotidyltransferase